MTDQIEELKRKHRDITTVMFYVNKALDEKCSDYKMIELLALLEWYHHRTECELNKLRYNGRK